jgi:hypothetical protein
MPFSGGDKMTWKQIEASREARLWVTQVIIPTLGMGTALIAIVPEIREAAVKKGREIKEKFKNRR